MGLEEGEGEQRVELALNQLLPTCDGPHLLCACYEPVSDDG